MNKMLRNTSFAMALACASMAFSSQSIHAQCASTKPDNSAQNKNQNDGNTADNQPNGKTDLQFTADIRKAIIADKDLSTYAHNVKIITKNGTVVLKGPVKSDDEKAKVVNDAANVIARDHITDQMTVKQ